MAPPQAVQSRISMCTDRQTTSKFSYQWRPRVRINRQTTDRHTDRQTDRQTDDCLYRQHQNFHTSGGCACASTDRQQTDRQTDRQTDNGLYRQHQNFYTSGGRACASTDRQQTDRQTDRQTTTYTDNIKIFSYQWRPRVHIDRQTDRTVRQTTDRHTTAYTDNVKIYIPAEAPSSSSSSEMAL